MKATMRTVMGEKRAMAAWSWIGYSEEFLKSASLLLVYLFED